MATAIFFGGRRINVPGAYSELDTTQLATVSPAAVGIVALVGTAEGGKPLTVESTFSDATRSDTIIKRYRSGDLRTASLFAFQPANDDAVPFGAQRLVNVKVNPATQSSATFDDALGNLALTLTSRDYGLFTTQINVEIDNGTTQGKKVTVVFESTTEVFDDVGGDPILDLTYTPGTNGYTTAVAQINALALVGGGTRADTGLDAQRTLDIPAPGVLDYVSSNAGDTAQQITVYGLNGTTPVSETITLNGLTNVTGTVTFSSVLGMRKSAPTAGTVTISDSPITVTLFTATNAQNTRGLLEVTNSPIVPSGSTYAIDTTAAGVNALIVTENAAGAEVMQRFDGNVAGPQALTGAGVRVKYLVLGDVPAARTWTLDALMFSAPFASYATVQRVVDFLNGVSSLAANALVANPTSFAMSDADRNATPTNILAVAGDFYADLYAIISTLNDGSTLVSAERGSPSPAGDIVPANTTGAVYLTGGSEGVTTIAQWQEAFRLLRKRRVNIIVPLTNDPAVHSLLLQHLRDRAGVLRSEANGYIGIAKNNGTGETRTNIKSQIVAVQNRQISAVSQQFQRADPDTGLATWYSPVFFAAIAAGMQAGSAIAEPLTYKKPLVLDIRNDASWNVEDDKEELIDAGLMMAEKLDGIGVRWVRSVTTYLANDNPVFTEMSANESADQAIYALRRRLELKIGNRGVAGAVGTIKGLANDELQRLVDDQIIVAYRALQVEQVGDVFPVSVEIAPVLPINFIPITVHLVVTRAVA